MDRWFNAVVDRARQDGFGGTFDGLGADAVGLGRAGDSAQLRGGVTF